MQTGADTSLDGLEELGGLSLADWLWAGGLILGSLLIAAIVRRLVTKGLTPQVAPLVARLLGRLAAALIFIFGIIYAMQQVGVSIAPLLGLVGLFGLALAFAFQDILENFIAGVIMSVRRPFRQGDEITTTDQEGVVEDIQLRAVTMRTYDGQRVYVPNAAVWRNAIVNHTELGSRRTTLTVGVAYDSNLEEVGRLLTDTLAGVDGVYADPAPQAYAYEFADSSINFALRFWHDPSIADLWRVRDSVAKAVKAALDEAGVEIPFPQRVVGFTGTMPPVAALSSTNGEPD